jgi:hypothetical protein
MILILTVILPVLAVIFWSFDLSVISWPVALLVLTLGGGGLLRIAYSLMFESQAGLGPQMSGAGLPGNQTANRLNAAGDVAYVASGPVMRPAGWRTDELELRHVDGSKTRSLDS